MQAGREHASEVTAWDCRLTLWGVPPAHSVQCGHSTQTPDGVSASF